jgi:hypothetical protein
LCQRQGTGNGEEASARKNAVTDFHNTKLPWAEKGLARFRGARLHEAHLTLMQTCAVEKSGRFSGLVDRARINGFGTVLVDDNGRP